MSSYEITLQGDSEDFYSCVSPFVSGCEDIMQFMNEHVDYNGFWGYYQGCMKLIQQGLFHPDITLPECSCDIVDDDLDFFRETNQHEDSCVVTKIDEITKGFSHSKNPLSVHITKHPEQISVVFSDEFCNLDETRVVYESEEKRSEITSTEVRNAFYVINDHFPYDYSVKNKWLWKGGSFRMSLDPHVSRKEDSDNTLTISISNTIPSKPYWYRLYSQFTVLDIPHRPITFDLREFPLTKYRDFDEKEIEKSEYTHLSSGNS